MKKLNAADATRRGYTHVMVRTVDTGVVVMVVAKFQYIFLSTLWIEFGVGKHLKYLPGHDMFRSVVLAKKSHKLFSFYDRACTCRKANDAWRDLFTRKGRYIEAIPPTSDALLRFPVERDTMQESTKTSQRQTFDVSDGNENLSSGTNRPRAFCRASI